MITRVIVVLLVILAIDAAIVLLLVSSGPALGVHFAAISIAMIALIALVSFHLIWRPVFARYPLQPRGLDATTRRFQSFSLGILNLGFSVHTTADEEFLHLEPLIIWQLLGAMPASVPWSALSPRPTPIKPLIGVAVRLDGWTLVGPRWCLERVGAREEPVSPSKSQTR
ncbi:MAG: hypothetical protein KF724_09570 [Phycisphaeraceae bacterium]|nr:hypothetical protein [Phycisphaeraceae bacterium]